MSEENNKTKSFSVVLATLEGGAFNDTLSREVQELIGDMSNHAQAYGSGSARGSVAINLDFVLKNGVFTVTAGKKITAPKERKSESIFWADKDNNLTEENPRQRKLDFGPGVEKMETRKDYA